VKSTIVDENAYEQGKGIDDLMKNSETASANLLSQVETTATIYDYGNDNYYAAKLNTTEKTGIYEGGAKDVAFARDNYNGEVVDGIKYDYSTGIAYIPKTVVDDYVAKDASADQGNVLQAQLLYAAPSSVMSETATQEVTLTNDTTGESVKTLAGSEM
jgi:hypothetical protein